MNHIVRSILCPILLVVSIMLCLGQWQANRLDDSWQFTVNGQTVRVRPDGSFLLPNISAPDQFGPGGPGTLADFVSDDYVRVLGVSTKGGTNRYAKSEFFKIRQGQTVFINNLEFGDVPPRKPESLGIVLSNRTAFIGQNLPLTVLARFADGFTTNVAPKTSWTSYRVSNPNIATISLDGMVSPLNPGVVYVTAVNEGVAATCGLNIVAGTDRLTIVTGTVVDTNSLPVAGATVSIISLAVAPVLSGTDGGFVIPGVPTGLGNLRVSAVLSSTNLLLTGFTASLTPVPGGQTDAGLIVLQSGFLGMVCDVGIVVIEPPLVAKGSVWKYFDNGSNQGIDWNQPSFDDSTWSEGLAELGYGDGDERTTVGFGGNPSAKFITTYFRRTITIAGTNLYANLLGRLVRDDGGVVYLNGVEIFRSTNMPAGLFAFNTLATTGGENTMDTFCIRSGLLVEGTNVIAVEMHQLSPGSADLSFDFELMGVVRAQSPGGEL